ncbi:hypothetical protein ACU01R_003747 [Yersinia enterocolitica]
MNISTDGMIAAIRSAAERVEPRESEVLNNIADRISELVASANKNRRTAKHYERECLELQGKYNAVVVENVELKKAITDIRREIDINMDIDIGDVDVMLADTLRVINTISSQGGAQ